MCVWEKAIPNKYELQIKHLIYQEFIQIMCHTDWLLLD